MPLVETKTLEETMLVVKVWCLPQMAEEKLRKLHRNIVRAVAYVKALGVQNETQMICLFPQDMMRYGLGEEIVIEVTGHDRYQLHRELITRPLANSLGGAVRKMFPHAHIECSIFPSGLEFMV
jgi:hypothetical protein